MSVARILLLLGLPAALNLASCASHTKLVPIKAPVLASRVELAAGDVKVGEDGVSQPVGTGTMLPAGSVLSVGPGGRALVRMADGTGLFLRDGTQLSLEEDGVHVQAGEVWFDVPKRDEDLLHVVAGGAQIEAEKAGFDVTVAGGEVSVRVIRGLAVVSSSQGRSEVGSGELATLSAEGAPKIGSLDFWEDWTGGMADHAVRPSASGRASGRIYAIDRAHPGSLPQDLQIRQQDVRVSISDDIARTEVSQSFFNPSDNPVEGWYWFTIPEGAAVTRFALMVDGQLIDGRVIERKQAAAQYEAAVQRAWDPALLEWVDGLTYRARIFPIPPTGERTVVLAYTELLPKVRGTTRYVYPMGDDDSPRIQEFSLSVDLGAEADLGIATVQGARIEGSGADRRITMRRSGFQPNGDFLLEVDDPSPPEPVRVMRYQSGKPEADYVMVRYSPEEDWDALPVPEGVVVVVVDTSVGGDASDRKLKTDAAEAILRALSSTDRFALVAADLKPRLVYPLQEGLASATESEISKAMEALSGVPTGGALDMGEVFNEALKLVHGAPQPAFVYIGDGAPTVGEMRSAEIVERLKRSLSGSPARLFTMAVGIQANTSLLDRLASVGGGQALRVDLPEQTVQRAIEVVGAVKTPTITNLKIDIGEGLDQVFTSGSGKVTRGQEVLVYGRTHHPLPGTVHITGDLVGKPFSRDYAVSESTGSRYAYAAPLWAMENLRYLLGSGAEDNRGGIVALGLDYQLMTPFTSFLTLENQPQPVLASAASRQMSSEAVEEADADRPMADMRYEREAKVAMDEAPSAAAEPAYPVSRQAASSGRSSRPTAPPPAPVSPSAPRGGSTPALAASRDLLLPSTAGASVAPGSWLTPRTPASTCSDASGRALSIRRDLWARRLSALSTIGQAVYVYQEAVSSCEIDGWKAEKTLIDLVLQRVRSASDIGVVLASFGSRPSLQDYMRTELLRRVMAPPGLLPTGIRWASVDALLGSIADPEKRLAELHKILALKPGDPEGLQRLLTLLVSLGHDQEALAVAARLRAGGYSAPGVLVVLGDLQADQGDVETARKTYSELVEYNPWDAEARRMLGDVFLRHGWYEDAYRQYATLLLIEDGDPRSIIRIARAAAGSGRTDEALRTYNRVLELSLEPSTSDPREWSRLWSASTLARLMIAQADADKLKALERTLKRTELFGAPATLYLLTWNNLDVDLTLALKRGDQVFPADKIEAGGTGLVAAWAPGDVGELTPVVGPGIRGAARRVEYQVQVVKWDGTSFQIKESSGLSGR